MKCLSCGLPTTKQKTVIRDGKIVEGCDACLEDSIQSANTLNGNHNRNAQRAEYRKDILQKWQSRDYARAFPDQAKELFGEENARRFS